MRKWGVQMDVGGGGGGGQKQKRSTIIWSRFKILSSDWSIYFGGLRKLRKLRNNWIDYLLSKTNLKIIRLF